MIELTVPNLPEPIRDLVRRSLSDIGYRDEWIHDNYEYAGLSPAGLQTHVIDLAAFAQYPPNYRDACIGVTRSSDSLDFAGVAQHRALGAPLVFDIVNEKVQVWKMRADSAPEKVQSDFAVRDFGSIFAQHRDEWSPSAIRRARRPDKGTLQFDFIDALLLPRLACEFQERLKFLLEAAVTNVKRTFADLHSEEAPPQYLFPFLFRFVMAKVFRDRNDVPGWEANDPRVLLQVAETHCQSGLIDVLPATFLHPKILESAWTAISTHLHFQNFSLSDLFFIYESCFIDRETRKALGVHNTPLEVADFVVAQLPLHSLPFDNRQVIEPFCGSGVFLAAALKRLAELYPADGSPAERHSYLQKNLVGIEKESLAIEVCRLVLTLVDYPNPNGWRLFAKDVFEWSDFDEHLKNSNIVVANPPFEEFTESQRRQYGSLKTGPPAEFLRRLLAHAPQMFGIVLPRSFTTAPDYREANRAIARQYGEVRTIELPENTFQYARVPTILLLAHDRREDGSTVSLRSDLVTKDRLSDFYSDWRVSETSLVVRRVPAGDEVFSLWATPPNALFSRFTDLPRLGSICEVHKGINWKPRIDMPGSRLPRNDVIRDTPTEGFSLGCEKMEGCLLQFRIGRLRYLSLLDDDQDPSTRANRRQWSQPKVVCNAARSAEPWRLRAYADKEGLAFSKQYFALWPTQDVSIFAIAALLCSPVANLFSLEHDRGRDNRIETIREFPIPPIASLRSGGHIARMSEHLHDLLSAEHFVDAEDHAFENCLRLDAAILDAYGLSAEEQRGLLARFEGKPRPTPFEFRGYFPPHFLSPSRLSEFVTIAYDWEKCNARRAELIDQEFEDRLSGDDLEELETLQRLAFLHTSLVSPFPMDELRAVRESAVDRVTTRQ